VTPKEQETALSELEERVDRLRVLYEQYFLGFEKLEPSILRKDVERRFAMLRKESIRNTALRYRFNVVQQKYSTYSMYWTRICRQIEEGTFKRHLQKAKKILEQGLGKKRDQDLSIDVDIDMDDFENADMDMDAILAEADASASSYANAASDTVPPAATDRPRAHSSPSEALMPKTGTGFVVTKRQREALDEPPPSSKPLSVPLGPTAAAMMTRPPGPAAGSLPAGKKLVRRKDGSVGPAAGSGPPSEEAPPSSRAPASVPKAPVSTPKIALPKMPGESAPRVAPLPAPRVAGPPQSSRNPAAAPPSTRTVPQPAPQSSPRIPAAPQSTPKIVLPAMPPRTSGAPASSRTPAAAPPPSQPRVPGATPSGAAAGRLPLPPPPARQSAGRLPLPPPSTPRGPAPSDPGDDGPPRKSRPPLPSQLSKKPEG
jgi:hypothetical protein